MWFKEGIGLRCWNSPPIIGDTVILLGAAHDRIVDTRLFTSFVDLRVPGVWVSNPDILPETRCKDVGVLSYDPQVLVKPERKSPSVKNQNEFIDYLRCFRQTLNILPVNPNIPASWEIVPKDEVE